MSTHTTTIDGITYTTKTLGATKGLCIMAKLISLFGRDGLDVLFKVAGSGLDEETKDKLFRGPEVVGRLLAAVAKNASEDEDEGGKGILVVKDLLVNLTADKVRVGSSGTPEDAVLEGPVLNHFDSHFDGRYMHLGEVVMWVAKCNFIGP